MSSVLKRFKTYGKQVEDLKGVDPSVMAVMAPVKRNDKVVALAAKRDKAKSA